MDQLIRLRTDYLYAEQNRFDMLRTQGGPADEFSGWKRFDLEKFEQVVLFFMEKLREVKAPAKFCGPLMSNKLLWHSDAAHVKQFGVSITGSRYARLNLGPVPNDYGKLYKLLEERGAIQYTDKETLKPVASFNPAALTAEELKSLERTWNRWKTKLNRIVDESHREKAWRQTRPAELISFRLVQ